MPATTNKSATWSAVRQQLTALDKPALLALLKDLYAVAPANRDFLHARFLSEPDDDADLEPYRGKVVEQFFPARGFGKLKLAEARKAIRDYGKATGNLRGVAELLLIYVENGVEFTCQYGDIDERFYSSITSALDELSTRLRSTRDLYPPMQDRLDSIAHRAGDIGWGFGDAVREIVGELDADFSGE